MLIGSARDAMLPQVAIDAAVRAALDEQRERIAADVEQWQLKMQAMRKAMPALYSKETIEVLEAIAAAIRSGEIGSE